MAMNSWGVKEQNNVQSLLELLEYRTLESAATEEALLLGPCLVVFVVDEVSQW
jgi:hypothetical protein